MLDKSLQELLTPVVTALGYELVGVEHLSRGTHNALVRVYIDGPNGINLDDCERVSYQISGVLDVQNPIPGRYTLEVSSPGLDRPLFTLEHFKRFLGYKINVQLTRPLEARRKFTGILQRVEGRNVIVEANDTEYSLPYEQISKAHLVPES